MLRAPILERKRWWSAVPVKHPHTYRRLPLEHAGAANKVSDIVAIRCHDRSFPLKLKMFIPANRAQKSFNSKEDKEESADWEAAKGIHDIREALLNLADVLAELWPYDDTARILQRILHNYNFGAALRGSEQEKVKIMVEFCDNVLRENASRAVELEPPLSFRQAKERWVDLTERLTSNSGGLQGQQQQPNHGTSSFTRNNRGGAAGGFGRGAASTGGSGSGFRAGLASKGRAARFQAGTNNYPVCFNFNRGHCGRQAKGCGCDDGRGGIFAHVCNFYDSATNKYCLQQHSRDGNH